MTGVSSGLCFAPPPEMSSAIDVWRSGIPMEQPSDPATPSGRHAWRRRGAKPKGAGSGERVAAPGGTAPRWRPAPTDPDETSFRRRRWWELAAPIGFSITATSLLGLFLWLLMVSKRQVPMILGIVTSYHAPLGPLPLAFEDRQLLHELSRQRSAFDPGTTKVVDVSESLREADAGEWADEFARQVSLVRPGGPGGKTVIVYLTAIGAVDRDGHACLVPPRVSRQQMENLDATWLRVETLIDRIEAKRAPSTNLVIVLDVCRPTYAESLGIFDGTFAAALDADIQATRRDRIWVLTSAGPGETAGVGAAEDSSVFAAAFSDALEGAADTKPWGDGNGRVSLGELAAYLGDEVNRRSILRHGQRQTPFVLPSPTGSDDIGIAWAVRRDPRQAPASAGAPLADGQLDWLRARWLACEKLRSRGAHDHPLVWAEYEQALLRAERISFAGSVDHDELADQKIAVETAEKHLTHPLLEASSLPGFRLARLAGLQSAETDPRWLEALDGWASDSSKTSDSSKVIADGGEVRDALEWRRRADEAWQRLVSIARGGTTIDRTAWDRWLHLVGPPPRGTTVPFEMHSARLLCRWSPTDTETKRASLARIALLSQSFVEAAIPDDVRADALLSVLAPRAEADAARRQAFDLALVGDEYSLAVAAEQTRKAESIYSGIAAAGRSVSEAWQLLDRVRAELPWLAIWFSAVRNAEALQVDTGPVAHSQSSSFDIDWKRLAAATTTLEELLAHADLQAPGEALIEQLRQACSDVRTQHLTLREAYDADCAYLAVSAADTPSTLAGIRAARRIPLADGLRRMQLLERELSLSKSLASQPSRGERSNPQPVHPDPARTGAGWVAWQGTLVNPLLPAIGLQVAPCGAGPASAVSLATTVGAWGQAMRLAVSRFERRAGGASPPQTPSTDTGGEAVVVDAAAWRRLAPLASALSAGESLPADRDSPAASQRRLAWHARLLTAAADSMDDFHAGLAADDPLWFADAAALCLRQASRLEDDDTASSASRARLQRLEQSALGWGKIEASPVVLTGAAASPLDSVHSQLTIHPAAGVPAGEAAVWLEDSGGGETVWLRTAPEGVPVRRVGVPIRGSDDSGHEEPTALPLDNRSASRLTGLKGSTVRVNAIYRGHRLGTDIPVVTADERPPIRWVQAPLLPPRIVLKGDHQRRESVSFIFDCSGSMGEQIPGGGRRFDVAKRALLEVLRQMAISGDWDASLWLYGHRTRWAKQADGSYQPALSVLGERERDAAALDGKPFDTQPGNDVQQVLSMQQLGPGRAHVAEQLVDRLAPAGETPLYLAIVSALKTDAARTDPQVAPRIVVITDGVNSQSGTEPMTVASDVVDTLSKVNRGRAAPVPIDVVAFDFHLGEQEKASLDELTMLVEKSRGSLTHATDGDRLVEALRSCLQLKRWQVGDAQGVSQSAEVGQCIELPAPPLGERHAYEVALAGITPPVSSSVTLSGGESLEMFVGAAGRGLEHRRYDGGTEQRIRQSQDDLPDPSNPQARWFVAAHLPRRDGNAVRFPISIQNADERGFSPRPFELWAEVQPVGSSAPQPLVFVDLESQPHRPVPVIDLVVPDWPSNATEAEIRVWFTTAAVEPTAAIDIAELPFDVRQTLPLPSLPGVSLEMVLERTSPESCRLRVVERHPPDATTDLPNLRLRMEPGCERATHHRVDPVNGGVRHEFELTLRDGAVADGTRLTLLKRSSLQKQAVAPARSADTPLPLTVTVPEN